MNNLIVTSENGSFIYHLAYQLSFLLGVVILLIEGYRRKFPMTSLLLIVALGGSLFIAGTKVGAYQLEEWQQLFSSGEFPPATGKTVVTGIIGGILGILVGRILLKFKPSILGAAAFVIPVAMILQRFGCLFAGCCYGSPTRMPWALQYADHYKIYGRHLADGLAEHSAGLSAPVHPVQLYEVLGFVLIIAILWSFRHRFKADRSLGVFSLGLVFSMRFIVEFFRDPVTNHGWGEMWAGLKMVQWYVLGAALFAGLLLLFFEKRAGRKKTAAIHVFNVPSVPRHLLLAVLLTILLWQTHGWFTPMETFVFQALVIFALISLAVVIFKHHTTPRFRWAMLSLVGISLVFMSQTVEIEGLENSKNPKFQHQFKFGYLTGNLDVEFDERRKVGTEMTTEYVPGHYAEDCDGDSYYVEGGYRPTQKDVFDTTQVKITQQQVLGGEWQWAKLKNNGGKSTGALGGYYYWYGRQPNRLSTEIMDSYGLYSWLGAEGEDFSLKAGFLFGKHRVIGPFEYRDNTHIGESVYGREYEKYLFSPILHFRVGDRHFSYFEIGLADDLPFGLSTSSFKGGFGFGNKIFGLKNEFWITAGWMRYSKAQRFAEDISEDEPMGAIYLDSEFVFGKKIILTPSIRFGQHPMAGVGLGLRF